MESDRLGLHVWKVTQHSGYRACVVEWEGPGVEGEG